MANELAGWLHNPSPAGGLPGALDQGTKSEVAQKRAMWLHNPCRLGGWGVPKASKRGAQSEVANRCTGWLQNARHLGGPQHFTAGDKIRTGPPVWWVATCSLPLVGSPTLHNGGQNEQWPQTAGWLHNPYRRGCLQRFGAGDKIRSDQQVGQVATYALPLGESATLDNRGPIVSGPRFGRVAA